MKAAIFDIDNTLYPYDICDNAGVIGMYEAYCRFNAVSTDSFHSMLSNAKRLVKTRAGDTAACHNRLLYAQALCEIDGQFSPEKCMLLYNGYWDAFLDKMALFDGSLELLEGLKAKGVRIGFCTDLTAHIQFRKMIRLGISHIPDAVVTSEECGHEKPHSSMFLTILEKLGTAPCDAVMIGDSIEKDIAGAVQCGISACLFGRRSDKYPYAVNYEELTEFFERNGR